MLRYFELLFIASFWFVVAAQVIYPLWVGKPVFDWFRRTTDLRHRIVSLHGEQEEAALEAEVERLETELHGEDEKDAR